jgi:LPS export ABC transporter protein LptC
MKARDMIVIAGALLLAAGCTKIAPAPSEVPKGEPPQQEFYGAAITFFQDDKLSAVLKAGRIRKFERQSVVLLDSGVVADFYNSEGHHTSTLWADSGRTDEARKDMIAMGNVVTKSDSGQILETNILRWDNRTRHIRSDSKVKLSTPTDTIYGIGFDSDEHLRNWNIGQPQGLTFRELQRRNPGGSDSVSADSGAAPKPEIRVEPRNDTLR